MTEVIANGIKKQVRTNPTVFPLSKDERNLIYALYFQRKTQVELEKETGIKQQTISYRERQIRMKLKKMMEK